MSCLFCDIAAKTKPADIVYEDEQAIAFTDIAPKSPVHILIVPKKHLASVDEIEAMHEPLIGHLIWVAKEIAREKSINESGYRLVFNTRNHAGQIIDHVHLHLLGGAPLGPMA